MWGFALRGRWGIVVAALLVGSSGCARKTFTRLVDCRGDHCACAFTYPHGEIHHLLLGFPVPDQEPQFSGTIRITDDQGKTVCVFPFSRERSQRTNWLADEGLDSYVLTWNDPEDWHAVRPGTRCNLSMDFSRLPPEKSSLWLSVVD